MHSLERFFNWQSDMDWTWGPLLPLRPPQNQPIRPWVWVRLFLAFTLLGILLLGLLFVLVLLLPKIAAWRHQPLPPPVSETLTTLRFMTGDPGAIAGLLGIALSLPILFFLFCLPYHWAWNRRAAHLRNSDELAPNTPAVPSDVWPPPIQLQRMPPRPNSGETERKV